MALNRSRRGRAGSAYSRIAGARATLGLTITYAALLIAIPVGALIVRAAGLSLAQVWRTVTSPRAVAAYELSFAAAGAAALINAMFGGIAAWVLVRYRFPGRRVLDAMVDLPFALPTAVAGIALTTVYAPNGWIGGPASSLGVRLAYTRIGIVLALVFVGLPFVIRTVQPVLRDLEPELEEAAATLGATRAQAVWRVIIPSLLPAALTGFTLALARAIGEYGSIVFISGNLPMKTEVVTLLIMARLEQYDYAGATAIATVMLGLSFTLLLAVNVLQRWAIGARAQER